VSLRGRRRPDPRSENRARSHRNRSYDRRSRGDSGSKGNAPTTGAFTSRGSPSLRASNRTERAFVARSVFVELVLSWARRSRRRSDRTRTARGRCPVRAHRIANCDTRRCPRGLDPFRALADMGGGMSSPRSSEFHAEGRMRPRSCSDSMPQGPPAPVSAGPRNSEMRGPATPPRCSLIARALCPLRSPPPITAAQACRCGKRTRPQLRRRSGN